jgi:hypothetical protein
MRMRLLVAFGVVVVLSLASLLAWAVFQWTRPTTNDKFADTIKVRSDMSRTAKFHSRDETKMEYVGPPGLTLEQIFVAPAMRYEEPIHDADTLFHSLGIANADGPGGVTCWTFVSTLRPEKEPLSYMKLSKSQKSEVAARKLAVYELTIAC